MNDMNLPLEYITAKKNADLKRQNELLYNLIYFCFLKKTRHITPIRFGPTSCFFSYFYEENDLLKNKPILVKQLNTLINEIEQVQLLDIKNQLSEAVLMDQEPDYDSENKIFKVNLLSEEKIDFSPTLKNQLIAQVNKMSLNRKSWSIRINLAGPTEEEF